MIRPPARRSPEPGPRSEPDLGDTLARYRIVYLGLAPLVVMAVSVLFGLPLVVPDLRGLGRFDPATLWGGLVLVGSISRRTVLVAGQ